MSDVAAAREDLLDRVREAGLLPAGRPVVVLLSGGRDSVCLLDMTVQLAGREAVGALHVNYGLRDGAGEDELLCRELCERLEVPLTVEAVRAPLEGPGNLQAWARDVRYAAGTRLAAAGGAHVAVGHTATDQVETIVYRLAASPGRRALIGMPEQRGRLVRPLLRARLTRTDTAAWCAARGLGWREDPSNETDRFARGRVRSVVIPALLELHPAAEANILRTAELLADEADGARHGRGDGAGRARSHRARPARGAARGAGAADRAAPGRGRRRRAVCEGSGPPGRDPAAGSARLRGARRGGRRARRRRGRSAAFRAHAATRRATATRTHAVGFAGHMADAPPIGEILVQPDQLKERVRALGRQISEDYADRDLLLVGVLKGAMFFLADLMRNITVPCEVDFMAVASYGSATDSSGVVRILKDLDTPIENRHVLIVEDIVDSGLTLQYLLRNLGARDPQSLEVCALLTKPERRKAEVPIAYTGFEIPNRFAIGYGLDYRERWRNLPYVAALAVS